MQSNQQNHSKLLTVILAGVASIGFAAAASAAGTLGANTHVGVGAQTAPVPGTAIGGAADAHMNASGNLNSNAQWKDSATQGLERAQERAGTAQDRVSTQASDMNIQAEDMRTQAQSQADTMKTQGQSQADAMKTQAGAMRTQAQQMKPTPRAQSGGTTMGSTSTSRMKR